MLAPTATLYYNIAVAIDPGLTMYYADTANHYRKKAVAIAAAFLIIWLGFAQIYHQFDTVAAHHEHHSCQQFSNINHGVHSSNVVVPAVVYQAYTEPETNVIKISRPVSAYDARSPPMII